MLSALARTCAREDRALLRILSAGCSSAAFAPQHGCSLRGSGLGWTPQHSQPPACSISNPLMQRFHSATLHHSNAQPELAIIEEELEEGQGSREAMAEDAQHDDFVQSMPAEEGPLAFYKENRLSGRYRRDPRQEDTIAALQQLYEELGRVLKPRRPSGLCMVDHVGETKRRERWWEGLGRMLEGKQAQHAPAMPRGLYMHGGVGTGKTMLMDLFVYSAPPHYQVFRTTFHDFMLDVHGRLHRLEHSPDPLTLVAGQLMGEFKVLALDEFFVTDVADATMLNRLFSAMWARGLVLVATSNRAPDALYENGLQRDLFLPFIARLKERTRVHDISSATDYRRLAQHRSGLFYTPDDFPDPDAVVDAQFQALAAACHAGVKPVQVEVAMGRHLAVPAASGGICLFSFSELCGRPVAAADYIGLTKCFHTLVLRGVPIFSAANRNEAYRFLTLVDVLYEHNIRLFASAAGSPFQLFEHIVTHQQQHSPSSPSSSQAGALEDCVDDNLGFSKERCISRLTEMQSLEYLMRHAKRYSPSLLLALEEAQERITGPQ